MAHIVHAPISSISQILLRSVDELWAEAFNWQPIPDGEEVEADPEASLFLLQSDNTKEVLATAVVKPFEVCFAGHLYSVQGILNVVSAVHRQGYGRIVMAAVKEQLVSEGQTGLGFSKRNVSPFYERCGYKVERDLVERFRERGAESTVSAHPDGDEDVIYVNDYANLVQTILSHPNDWAYIPEFW